MKIRYLAVAQAEIQEAAEYYAAISPELGLSFRRELRQLMRLVGKMPMAWPPSGEGTRRCLMSRFPYLVSTLRCRRKYWCWRWAISTDSQASGGSGF